jgi:hypothetical protein
MAGGAVVAGGAVGAGAAGVVVAVAIAGVVAGAVVAGGVAVGLGTAGGVTAGGAMVAALVAGMGTGAARSAATISPLQPHPTVRAMLSHQRGPGVRLRMARLSVTVRTCERIAACSMALLGGATESCCTLPIQREPQANRRSSKRAREDQTVAGR